jgi:hypothetical protein
MWRPFSFFDYLGQLRTWTSEILEVDVLRSIRIFQYTFKSSRVPLVKVVAECFQNRAERLGF